MIRTTTLALSILSAACLLAQPGTLDNTFATDGTAELDTVLEARIALQPDGRIVVGGVSSGRLAAARYLADGTLDTSFGSNGVVAYNATTSGYDLPTDILIQPDGKILLTGRAVDTVFVARLLPDGSLDSGFGMAGVSKLPFVSPPENWFLGLQFGDHPLVLGTTSDASDGGDLVVMRLHEDGVLDSDFGTGGTLLLDGQDIDHASAIDVRPDGKILVGGYTDDNGTDYTTLFQRLVDGAADASFGNNGYMQVDASSALAELYEEAKGMALATDGSVILLGQSGGDASSSVYLVKVTPGGVLDPTFGTGGVASRAFTDSAPFAKDVAVRADGQIVMAGTVYDMGTSENDAVVFSMNSDGSVDPWFGTDGIATTDIVSAYDDSRSIALQPDGKVLLSIHDGLAGYSVIARFDPQSAVSVQAIDGRAVRCYPNPTSDLLRLEGLQYGEVIFVRDALGRDQQQVRSFMERTTIDVGGLAPGAYSIANYAGVTLVNFIKR